MMSSPTAKASGSMSKTLRPAKDQTALIGQLSQISASLATAVAAMPRGMGIRWEVSHTASSAQPK
eukprot:2232735-Alexandrium_andersonii.AAC.1